MPDERVVRRFDIAAALAAELKEPSSLLPSRSAERALAAEPDRAVAYLRGRLTSNERPEPPEVVVAAKSSRGFRPVHALDIESRVRYRALVDLLATSIDYPDRGDEAYDLFNLAPTTVESATHVVRADVASFYQYIDHQLLEAELVRQSGDAQVADQTVALLGEIMGRQFGLPQTNGASHALADCYIDVVERRLVRLGLDVWRYNDDFAVATASRSEAQRSLEHLEDALRSIGLTLNEEKSIVHTADAYSSWATRRAEVEAQIAASLDVDLLVWILLPATEYVELPEDDDADGQDDTADEATQIAGAVRTLDRWLDYVRSEEPSQPLERSIYRGLARDAIRVLRRRLSDAGLPYVDALLAFEPQMTHTVCRYLGRLAYIETGSAEVVSELIARGDTHFSAWQQQWLLEPLISTPSPPASLLTWAEERTRSSKSASLRARAALALATHGRLPPADLGALFDESTEAARPDLVIAAVRAFGATAPAARSITDESELLRIVAEHEAAR